MRWWLTPPGRSRAGASPSRGPRPTGPARPAKARGLTRSACRDAGPGPAPWTASRTPRAGHPPADARLARGQRADPGRWAITAPPSHLHCTRTRPDHAPSPGVGHSPARTGRRPPAGRRVATALVRVACQRLHRVGRLHGLLSADRHSACAAVAGAAAACADRRCAVPGGHGLLVAGRRVAPASGRCRHRSSCRRAGCCAWCCWRKDGC